MPCNSHPTLSSCNYHIISRMLGYSLLLLTPAQVNVVRLQQWQGQGKPTPTLLYLPQGWGPHDQLAERDPSPNGPIRVGFPGPNQINSTHQVTQGGRLSDDMRREKAHCGVAAWSCVWEWRRQDWQREMLTQFRTARLSQTVGKQAACSSWVVLNGEELFSLCTPTFSRLLLLAPL